ncbi:hypothetical protein ACOMHN_009489 [Nucella lapillus]
MDLEAGSIQAIDKQSVHRICSGQVVLTLATAVKELVENSIDAGATTVDIKLKEYGSENIEVTDNASGVEEKNFVGLTQKHHTSKLSDFNDLTSVETFGFRGEALSSLCALSHMTVTTRHKSVAVGTKLEYDANGHIVSKTPTPRQQGSTVCLQNLFHTLPVRHKEFQRNVKKEFGKMVQVLNAYCLINTGVRITCSNQTSKGSRSTVVSTSGNATVKDNISNIFGPKQLQSLLPFEQRSPTEDVCIDYGIKTDASHSDLFSIEGFVSKCEHGQGRSSTDRQFVFINRRPCDATKVLKVINEVYHSYNRHQYPFVVLLVSMAKESVDVNVTPDKRQIFLEGEKVLLATIKTSLVRMFEPTTSVLRVNLIPHQPERKVEAMLTQRHSTPARFSPDKGAITNFFKLSSPSSSSPSPKRETLGRASFGKSVCDDGGDVVIIEDSPSDSLPASVDETDSITATVSGEDSERLSTGGGTVVQNGDDGLLKSSVRLVFHRDLDVENSANCEQKTSAQSGLRTEGCGAENLSGDIPGPSSDQVSYSVYADQQTDVRGDIPVDTPDERRPVSSACVENDRETLDVNQSCAGNVENSESGCSQIQTDDDGSVEDTSSGERAVGSAPLSFTLTQLDQEGSGPSSRPESELMFSFQHLRECLSSPEMAAENEKKGDFSRSFRAKIAPTDNKTAEEELQREISKDMFAKMDVLGQFNLGFIIAKNREDLFIVDQHATDEKYNFEMLRRHTVLQSQQLICPQNLELTASNEIILMDNLDIFTKNGFDFLIDETAPPMQRVKLKSTPVSKNWNFGKDDIEELIFMLTDSPGIMCRPSRVRMMFASRACRKSIMIGTHLNKMEMKKLLCHMGEIEQPWNCPHGRPTMRHLINLNMLPR